MLRSVTCADELVWHTLRVMGSVRCAAVRRLCLAVILVAALTASGCQDYRPEIDETPVSQQLAFTFHRITGPGLMDQQMEIVNYDSVAVVPRLRYTPVDSAGAPLDGVVATAAYGSNEGKMMVPARQSSFDVLAFTGRDVAKVAGVQVDIETLTPDLGFPAGAQLAQPQALDGEGQPTSKREPFSAVELTNPNAAPVTEGVVCIEWSQPPPGQPQQARAMITLGYITIDAHASATLRPAASASAVLRTGCGSLKSFFAPGYLAM